MVKIVRAAATGPEIVTLRDLTGPVTGAAPAPSTPASALQAAGDAVNSIDKWINIADKGITMLGRFDSILGKVQNIRGAPAGQQQQRIPVQRESEHIEYEHGTPAARAGPPLPPPDPAAVTPAPAPAAPVLPAGGISVPQLVQVMSMIDNMQPGITVAELRDAILRNPVGVGHLLSTYEAMGAKPK